MDIHALKYLNAAIILYFGKLFWKIYIYRQKIINYLIGLFIFIIIIIIVIIIQTNKINKTLNI